MSGMPLATFALDIKEISVRGNTLIPESTILAQIDSKVGLPYNPRVVTEDLQKIYNLGFFSAIDVDTADVAGGVQLTFILKELPSITTIEFKGNKKLKDDDLKAVLTLPPSDLPDPLKLKFYPFKIKADVENLKQLYHKKGFHQAQITSALIPDSSDPQGKVALHYTIEEQQKVSVKGIHFKGNAALSAKELRKVMQTNTKGFFSFITGSGKYEEDILQGDLERLKFLYADHGYIDMRVADSALDFRENSDLYITITVEEGAKYNISKVAHSGNTVYADTDIQKVIKVVPNEPFSRSKILQDRLAIADLYAQKGYVTPISEKTAGKLLIDPRIRIDREKRQVELAYVISEGVPHVLNRITIAGNQTTRDKVIRRELSLQEGELFNSTKLKSDQRRVLNLGFFDEVKFNLADGSEANTLDMDAAVTEGSRGSFNFGGGWGSIEKWTVTGGVATPNLFGLGHALEFSATLGSKLQTFSLDYTMPYFLDSQYTVGLEAYNIKREYHTYDSNSTGGSVRFGRKIAEDITGTVKYGYELVDITNVAADASARIKEAEGSSRTSSVALILNRSTINNVMLPTKGMSTKLSGEVAGGILQGNNDFYKIILDHNLYIPLIKDTALRLRGEYAYANAYGESAKVPIFERFFGGGFDVIRGYDERSIGPQDENGEALGGNQRIVLTSEVIIPISKEFRFLTFFDMGDVYGPDEDVDIGTFKKSVGVGARLYTPFGLIKVDWGYKLKREEGESASKVHFGFGSLF